MSKELVISSDRHETKLAILEDGQLVEIYFQRANEYSLVGSIHKGRVTRVLPGMQSAFVNIGLDRDAFLYVSDFFEETGEDYERLGTEEVKAAPPPPPSAAEPANGKPAQNNRPAPDARPPADGDSRDRRGRRPRRRRRGRGLPENKFAPAGAEPAAGGPAAEMEPRARPEPEAETFTSSRSESSRSESSIGESEALILPGESLAKYRGRDGSAITPEPDETPEVEASFVDAPAPDPHSIAAIERMTEEEITQAIEDAVEARLEEFGEDSASDVVEGAGAVEEEEISTDEDFADQGEEASDGEEEEARAAELEAGEEGESFREPEDGSAIAAEAEELGEQTDEEREGGEATQASAEVRDQPVARYIAPRERRPRRRGRGGEGRGGEARGGEGREGRERKEGLETAERKEEEAPVSRPARERGRERERAPLPSIADLLKDGQEIIVQIRKEPLGQKGARITSHVAIPGRYVVYMPTIDHHGVSRKVGTDDERARLKRLLQTHSKGMTGGFIVRTAGEGKQEADVAADMSFLYNLWLDIRKKAEKRPAPCLLHHDLELVQRTLRDQVNDQFKAIWVDSEEAFESIITFLERFQPSMVTRVKLYTRDAPIFDAFNITTELEKALRPKVWLKSGGFIVINQTEALVAIDVNTGKYVGRTSRLEDTIVKTNTEAVKEIARQIRLRDLGGIIVVDFIDMDERRNRQKVMQALEEAMRSDRAPYKILQFNDFGLVAITRRRVKQSLERALCTPCPVCEGAGYVKSVDTVVGEIMVEAHKIAPALESKEAMLRVNPDVALILKSNQHKYLEELEEILGRPVLVTGDPLLHPEKFDLA